MDILEFKAAYEWFLLRACFAVLAAIIATVVCFKVYEHIGHLKAAAKRYGWPLVTLFIVCSAWATFTAFPTSAEKNRNVANVEMLPSSNVANSQLENGEQGTLTSEDFARGFVLTRIGTNEVYDFSAPSNAVVCSDWLAFGAAEDWIYLREIGDWEEGTVLRIHSDGWVGVLAPTSSVFVTKEYYPLKTKIGIVPKVNWSLLAESSRPNQVWYTINPNGSLILTWQNVLLNRNPATPLSFQTEFKLDGQFIYRYDFSQLNVDAVTNILTGASFAGNTWVTNSLSKFVTSMSFYPLAEEDINNQDRDGDSLTIEDELIRYHTDPALFDTDFDGVSDGVEVNGGTNPTVRDSDGDGYVDGSDPNPTTETSLADLDADGIPDAYENHWFGGTNAVNSFDGYGVNGFNLGFEFASGINPTNGVSAAFTPTKCISAWKITDGFIAQSITSVSNIYEQTFNIKRNGSWEQYFVSSKPDRADGWHLEGLALDWEDSEGGSGTVTASPVGDSFYIPVSSNSPTNLTLRLRQRSNTMACRSPLYLLAYSPNIEIADAQRVATSNATWFVVTMKEETTASIKIDRSERPCKAALYPEEEIAEFVSENDNLVFGVDGTMLVNAPSVYQLPNINLAFLNPSITYGYGHYYGGDGLGYDYESATYSETYEYPIDSGCLWREWHSDSSGGYSCDCTPELSVGFDIDNYTDISTNITVSGSAATGFIFISGTQVWSDTATHDTSTDGGNSTRIEHLSDDECNSCTSCEDGNCDNLEGGSLGSLKFRIPLGVPRKEQVSAFAWFMAQKPLLIDINTLKLFSRGDADVTDMTSINTRTITCSDNRGRTLTIASIPNGVRIVITSTMTGALEHTWELTNVRGSPSQIRLHKISRLSNTMSDETYTYSNGNWTKFDNVSQTSEELITSGDINIDGYKREERIVRDANNIVLSHTVSESERFGSFRNAVLRQTYYAEKTHGEDDWNESFASYYTDNDNPKRNGNIRLEHGNARAWRFNAYDTNGRTVLTLDQYNGSWCPEWHLGHIDANAFDGQDIIQWLGDERFTAVATIYDYAPHPGDDAADVDANKVRTESRYLVNNGILTLIGRTWMRYTHGTKNGHATVTVETISAGAHDAEIGDIRNQHTSETRYDDDATGIPLALRGQVISSTDADGLTTENTYTISGGVMSQMSQKFYMSEPFPIIFHSESCTTYGNTLREWRVHTASNIAFDEKRYLYDDKNRLISTIYADGSFTTNAYSCCRLLNTIDRTGRKILRSAVTGKDHLYYAMEEVSIAKLPHDNRYIPYGTSSSVDNHYRVTQHFFDALGRETNTTIRVAQTPSCATNQYYVFNKGWRTSETTVYPYGVSDYEIFTDARGNETTTIRYMYSDCEVVETVETNKTTISTSCRNGLTSFYEGWADGKWKETENASSYDTNGCRIDVVSVLASDYDTVTQRIIYRDFLGRIVRETTPTSDVTYTYDGTSSRVLSATDSFSGETTIRLYDNRGDAVGQLKKGITSRNDLNYEVKSNTLWQVTTQSVVGGVTNLIVVTKERLSNLSEKLRSETLTYQNGALASHTFSSFDVTNSILTEVFKSATTGTTTTKSKFGITFETITEGGTISSFFDPYGRVFYTEKDGRSVDWIGRNNFGDIEEYDIFYATGDNVYAEFYGYDKFGNRTSATNALGAVTICAYDAANKLAESIGAVYPLRNGYDTAGRRTSLTTFRTKVGSTVPIAAQGDTTSWVFHPATGFCTIKTYADGSMVTYSHTLDGKPLRTVYASGRWSENSYNAKRELASVQYSDGEVCAFQYDEFSQEIAASNGVATVVQHRSNYGQSTNEIVVVDNEAYSLNRVFDAYGRMIRNNGADYIFATDGQLATISNVIANVEYLYTADRLDAGYTLTVTNGVTFTRALTRDVYRRSLVTAIESSVGNNPIETFAYSYDALNRPISRNSDIFGYNDRSEVVDAFILGNAAKYGYDEIGNSTNWIANSLNQYNHLQYDLDGNLLTDGNLVFSYDAANRLKTVSSNGVLVLMNFYDAKSRRVKKVTQNATTTFFYDVWNLIEERVAYTNGTTSTIHYYWGKDLSGSLQGAGGVGGLLYQTVDDVIYIPCYDNNGNVTKYIDSNGNIVASYTYNAFGNLISKSGSLADFFRHRFSTKYFDTESNLYYYGYRFYHPILMRWLNRDPIEENGGLNLYGFCGNRINFYDFLGMSCTLGTFNILEMSISATPQSVRANLVSLEKNAKELLDSLEQAGVGMSALSLATSTGFSSLLLSLSDEIVAGNVSLSAGDFQSAITDLLNKIRQTPLRLEGIIKWEKCECKNGVRRWIRQSDIKDYDDVPFENIGMNSIYYAEFRTVYKKLEKILIKKLYDNLR